MSFREVIQLPHAAVRVEERPGYLFLVESGQLADLAELGTYMERLQAIIERTGIDRAIIDARGEQGDPPPEVRNAMWEWLLAPDRGFTMVAFILGSEMAVARVNMTSLSRRGPVRAFENLKDAQRWLMRGLRTTTAMSLEAFSDPSSSRIPSPPPPRPSATAPTEPPPKPREFSPTPPRIPTAPVMRKPSGSGFRPPTPGPSERANAKVAVPTERDSRSSELRPRGESEDDDGSQVA